MTSMPFEPSVFHIDDLSNMIYGAMSSFTLPTLSWTDAPANAVELTLQWMAVAAIPCVQYMNAWMTFATSMSGIANIANHAATPALLIPGTDAPSVKTVKVTGLRSKKY